jgi:hypothetical protein
MRKLGKGQSVVFCIPTEIQTKIMAVTGNNNCLEIDVSDVLVWSIHETYSDLRRSMPLWAAQGTRFLRQGKVWEEITNNAGISMTKEHAERFLENDAPSLEARYRPRRNENVTDFLGEFDANDPKITEILEQFKTFEGLETASATLQEEQEREMSPEIEQERQVERPPPTEALTHQLHRDVEKFVQSGVVPPNSPAFIPAFKSLADTTAAELLDVDQFPHDMLVTVDYAKTVKMTGQNPRSDAYQRPIQWILTSMAAGGDGTVGAMAIISPFEAQELMPRIKNQTSSVVFLHIYAPRSTLSVPSLDDLTLHTVPPLPAKWRLPTKLRVQLNLFCGQLYFGSFDEYKSTCDFLGLASTKAEDGVVVQADGFIVGKQDGYLKKSPVMFLKVLFTKIRRNCEGIEKTHWGRIMGGEVLTESDFE